MKVFPRTALMLAVALSLAACNQAADDAAPDDAAPATAESAGTATEGMPAIEGLPSEKDRVSYMLGMDIARNLEPIKDEVDPEVVARAMGDVFAGNEPLMTEEQGRQVAQAFQTKMQQRQMEEARALAEKNKTEGDAFLADNAGKEGVQTTESGLQYQVVTQGEGETPDATDTVRVHYVGTLLDGSTFDSSRERGEPAEFRLDQVVPGWSEGVALMPVGSTYKFWIPPALGYGESGVPGAIPPNAVLSFEVELLDIVDQGDAAEEAAPASE
ncbi:FKBP-type peptidyl-prolyl cis-trans isomerase [Coralloluteibacterium stylophorae]|uniref:Peptidyl-prolyl cis-trans isomerase n=1 Tax=Coralloluteibacterium stylophorae TaxID=1776034 RepID=A0AAP2FX82_9GAMM|nr:FKBP-type peptidyl-prolyl cis-trans isomerase [Coralloluteibacterium stylophorae]MBS7456314.1 FKBP-type peptidyl-prolyl cis-trans isomerase [Coralloluteibacterium stylophorae]